MSKAILDHIEEMRIKFKWNESDDEEFLLSALSEEVEELKESIHDRNNFKGELADVLTYAITLAMINGWDYESLIHHKIDEVMTREY